MSRLNDTIAYLIAAWTAAVPSWQVIDSGPATDPELDFLVVGYTAGDESPIAVTANDSGAPARRDNETYDIASEMRAWSGRKTPAQVRDDLIDAYNACRDAIRADRTLGGLALDARTGDYEIDVTNSAVGYGAVLRFPVRVEVYQ